jgi:hypothetical protein
MGLGSGIRYPEKTYSGSRIQGSKRHWIPDPDPKHCIFRISRRVAAIPFMYQKYFEDCNQKKFTTRKHFKKVRLQDLAIFDR